MTLTARPRVFDLRISQHRTWKGFLSRAQSSWLDTIPLINKPSPSEFKPILPPTSGDTFHSLSILWADLVDHFQELCGSTDGDIMRELGFVFETTEVDF